jgi:hypothetical protein
MRPEAFEARFLPRSAGIRKVIEREAQEALEELKVYDGESKVTLASVM